MLLALLVMVLFPLHRRGLVEGRLAVLRRSGRRGDGGHGGENKRGQDDPESFFHINAFSRRVCRRTARGKVTKTARRPGLRGLHDGRSGRQRCLAGAQIFLEVADAAHLGLHALLARRAENLVAGEQLAHARDLQLAGLQLP